MAARSNFVSEAEAYGLIESAGLRPPRFGFCDARPSFCAGDPVVLKGLGEDLWHKSEVGAVRFMPFDAAAIGKEAEAMKSRVMAAGHRWIGGLVCERIAIQNIEGLPTEAFVSMSRHEAGWIALFGIGGLRAEALAAEVRPLCLPVALLSPAEATAEAESHLLGRVWLGSLRGSRALTTRERLFAFFEGLWRLAAAAETAGLDLLEMNPVALDAHGVPRPLDAVGRREPRAPSRLPPPADFFRFLKSPRRVAIAGVGSQPGGMGRIILENVRRCPGLEGGLLLIKPGQDQLLGLPCVPDVSGLKGAAVDLLIVALPAAVAARMIADLIAQGGGANVVGLVSGGFGDGADSEGHGARLAEMLREARALGRWTPAVLGPNFMGYWRPAAGLNTTFIPVDKQPPPDASGGPLALLTQSGALMLCRLSRNPRLRLGCGIALGNELDAALPDYLEALAGEPDCQAVAAYLETFGPGHLDATLRAALRLKGKGVPLLLYRAGRTEEGRAAAASHTGAMAGDLVLERAVLQRAGVHFAETLAAFDAALAWLSVYPRLKPGPIALLTNAGFEAVNGSDQACVAAVLDPAAKRKVDALLDAEKLSGLVVPRLPLDLTPMARESAFLGAADILLGSDATALVVGLVPFTRNLDVSENGARMFAESLAALAHTRGKAIGVAVDAGAVYENYRAAFAAAGLPVFTRVEEAFLGLKTMQNVP